MVTCLSNRQTVLPLVGTGRWGSCVGLPAINAVSFTDLFSSPQKPSGTSVELTLAV